MKVEYLHEGTKECPLIRIFGGLPDEYKALYDAIGQLANGDEETVSLKSLHGFEAENNCNIKLIRSPKDIGLNALNNNNCYEWSLCIKSWSVVYDLISPFTNKNNRLSSYQWLSGKEAYFPLLNGNVSLLISLDGSW